MSVSVGAGVEDEAGRILCEPKSDVVLLMDLQFGSQEWKDLLLWRIKQAQKSSGFKSIHAPCNALDHTQVHTLH